MGTAAVAARPKPNTQCNEQQGMILSACPLSDGHRLPQSELNFTKATSKNARPLVSKGSVGHPYSCAEACKYAKKKKGCKDRALCDHCHLCDWKRYKSGRAACRAAARSEWESR